MPSTKKKDIVSSLLHALKERDSVVLADYSGLTHKQLAELRTKIFEAGGLLQVVKNNLLVIALKDAQLPLSKEKLIGPTVVLLSSSKDPSPIKVLYQKGKELESLAIKWGIWEKGLLDKSKIEQLALLPAREELLAKLVGSLNSPQTRLVLTLKGNLQKLVIALGEIRKQKSL